MTHFFLEERPGAGSVQHDVCEPCFFCQRYLALDALKRLCTGEPVPLLEPGDLGFAVGGDDDDAVDALVHTGFEEERHFIDEDSMWSAFGDLADEPLLFAGHSWMNNTFESPEFAAMVKNNGAERMTIDTAIGIQHPCAECLDDLSPGWFAGLYHAPCELVCINDDGATALEHLGDRAFAGGHTACEPHNDHAAENNMGIAKKSLAADAAD